MKKFLPILFFILFAVIVKAQTAFAPGNLVVYRYGGTLSSTSNLQVPTFLDEYKKDGTFVRTIALPTATDVNQRALTGIATATQEGTLSRSTNGAYLTIMGFEVAPGLTTTTGLPRVVGRISASGEVNTATAVSNSIVSTPRSAATVDGSAFWMAGTGSSAIRYFPFEFNKGIAATNSNTTFTTPAIVGDAGTGNFYTYIFNNQLYYSTTSTIRKMGTGLPQNNTGVVNTTLPGFTTGTRPNPFQFIMFDTNADSEPDLMYMASEATAPLTCSIVKYVFDGSTWVNKGALAVSGKTENMRFMTAELSDGNAVIYCTSIGNTSTSTPSALYKITNSLNEDLSNTISLQLIATAPANTTFRGVAFAPVAPSTNPVKLGSFDGKKLSNGTVQLSWTTLAEKENSHFEILRSHANSEQVLLCTIQGNGTSDKINNYSYSDATPLKGTNYYQLNQVDYNGKSEKFRIVVVNTGMGSDSFFAYLKDNNTLTIHVETEAVCDATVSVKDISGKELFTGKVLLEKGLNVKEFSLNRSSPGVGVITLSSDKTSKTIKFIK